jgi:hypothetical protein
LLSTGIIFFVNSDLHLFFFSSEIYLPQHFSLKAIHDYFPNATFILNLRPTIDWVNSVSNWFGLGGRFLRQFHIDHHKTNRTKALEEIFDNHTALIRDFVVKFPTHKLIEVNIADPKVGDMLAESFGLNKKCWAKHNQNRKKKNNS